MTPQEEGSSCMPRRRRLVSPGMGTKDAERAGGTREEAGPSWGCGDPRSVAVQLYRCGTTDKREESRAEQAFKYHLLDQERFLHYQTSHIIFLQL